MGLIQKLSCLIKCRYTSTSRMNKRHWILKVHHKVRMSKKNHHSLSRERITVMTSAASNIRASSPNLEFVFKGVGNVSVQWALKGSYRLEHVLKFIKEISTQPCSFFPGNRKIFTLDDYSAHLHPEVKKALKKKGYFLVILPEGITGDLQVNDTDVHHPLKSLKSSYQEKESLLLI